MVLGLLGLLGLTTTCAAVVLQTHAPSACLLAAGGRPRITVRMAEIYETGGIGQFADRKEGLHATGYRFMPVSTLPDGPPVMIFAIAGAYPGLTAEQLQAPDPLPYPEEGKWNYHRLISDAILGGFVALPGAPPIMPHPNTVAVVCSSSSLGLETADGQEHEVVALINRSDKAVGNPSEFDSQVFYALADESGSVHIRWIDVRSLFFPI